MIWHFFYGYLKYVLLSDTRIVVNRTITNAAEGDWVILACRSLFGEGLKYCSFVTPSGVGYSLTNRKPTKHDRYAYVGNGLANGKYQNWIYISISRHLFSKQLTPLESYTEYLTGMMRLILKEKRLQKIQCFMKSWLQEMFWTFW